jgi:hypothetical protein
MPCCIKAAKASPALLNLREGQFSGHMQRQVGNSSIIRLDQGNWGSGLR